MASRNLTERVEVLEMDASGLKEGISALEGRMSNVEAQIVLLRTEMRGEFSAVRSEMRMLHEEVLDRIAKIGEGSRPPRRRRR
jgi:hypothetical protein